MEKYYLLQVLGTYYEVSAYTVDELRRKGKALKERYNLNGMTYRIFIGTRTNPNEFFKFGPVAKEAVFA